MPERSPVETRDAPAALGPYSQAIRCGDLLFCSGQIPLDPRNNELVGETPAEQAQRCLENLQAVCRRVDADLSDAVRCTIYMTDLSAFREVNDVYANFFRDPLPARVTVQVAALPRGVKVEIDAIVALDRPA